MSNGQMEDTVKLEWLVHELGGDAGLAAFARKYHELFGEKIGLDSRLSNDNVTACFTGGSAKAWVLGLLW